AHVGEPGAFRHLQLPDVLDGLHQVDAAVGLAHGAFDLGMPRMADHHHLATLLAHPGHFHVDLGHQRAGRVEDPQPAGVRLVAHRPADAVGGEDHGGAVRYLLELVDEHGTLRAQVGHHVIVVHDLVADVDRGAVDAKRALHDLDRSVDAGAESARLG